MSTQITLEQWHCLIAVVDCGGYAQAAQTLCKSQSAVSYAIQKIETQLGLKAFEIQGRKAVLTPSGHMLYRRAQFLLTEAENLERAARKHSAGWEAVIRIAAEILTPPDLLLSALHQFSQESPNTRVELIESVLGGTEEALNNQQVDLAISPLLPPGFLGDLLLHIRVIAVSHYAHPLQQQGTLSYTDLQRHRHIVVRDSGGKRDQRAVSVEINQRWTVSHIATSIQAVCSGYGFSWLPEQHIINHLASGLLKPLPLNMGGVREAPLYLILANPDLPSPGAKRLADIIKQNALALRESK